MSLGEQPPVPGFATWADALGDSASLRLYFEVNLPSPAGYRGPDQLTLERHLDERMLAVPSLLRKTTTAARRKRLEGTTKVDAVLISGTTHFAVLFEAKVFADMSCGTSYDVMRNQLVRNIDVMLEANPKLFEPLKSRAPESTCLVLLTPEVFREDGGRKSRLYGWLYDDYKKTDSELLRHHLPHRSEEDLTTIPDRLGWLTWEDCNRVRPGACPWLETPNSSFAEIKNT
jgi:hypothetical protein